MRRPNTFNQQGIALVLALAVLALLTGAILEFDFSTRRQLREAMNFRDELKATALAKAGVAAARAILQEDARLEPTQGRMFDSYEDLWGTPLDDYPVGDGLISLTIEDEQGKFNLNDFALRPAVQPQYTKHNQFTRLLDQVPLRGAASELLADAITDWIDADDDPELDGAESRYYQARTPPYQAHNRPLVSLEELHLVKGFTDETVRQLEPLLTVYPQAPNGVINMNTASIPVLLSLHPQMTEEIARNIVRGRPFQSRQDLDQVPGMEQIAKELRTTGAYNIRSQYYSVVVNAAVNGTSRTAKAVVRRKSKGPASRADLLYLRID